VKLFNKKSGWNPCITIPMRLGIFSVDFGNKSNMFAYAGSNKKVNILKIV